MKQQKQLVLTCYKVEVTMTVEAWYFLHGTTDGACNLFYFLSLLSRMATEDTRNCKRGMEYSIRPGQADGSMLSLAKEWDIGRKAVCRLLEDFGERGLIRVDSNPLTSVIDLVCIKSWMKDGRVIENPTYRQTAKAYEGVRIYLFNGQELETLRKSSVRKKVAKNTNEAGAVQTPQPIQPVGEEKTPHAESKPDPPMTDTGGNTTQDGEKPQPMQDGRILFDV